MLAYKRKKNDDYSIRMVMSKDYDICIAMIGKIKELREKEIIYLFSGIANPADDDKYMAISSTAEILTIEDSYEDIIMWFAIRNERSMALDGNYDDVIPLSSM